MNWIKTIVLVTAMFLAFLIGMLGVTNQEELSLKFAVWETRTLSVFWWLLIAFTTGLLFGVLNGAWFNLSKRLEARRLKKRLAQAEKELDQLKSAASSPTSAAADTTVSAAAQS